MPHGAEHHAALSWICAERARLKAQFTALAEIEQALGALHGDRRRSWPGWARRGRGWHGVPREPSTPRAHAQIDGHGSSGVHRPRP